MIMSLGGVDSVEGSFFLLCEADTSVYSRGAVQVQKDRWRRVYQVQDYGVVGLIASGRLQCNHHNQKCPQSGST